MPTNPILTTELELTPTPRTIQTQTSVSSLTSLPSLPSDRPSAPCLDSAQPSAPSLAQPWPSPTSDQPKPQPCHELTKDKVHPVRNGAPVAAFQEEKEGGRGGRGHVTKGAGTPKGGGRALSEGDSPLVRESYKRATRGTPDPPDFPYMDQ